MGSDFYSYNRAVLVGRVFRVGEISKHTERKTQTIRLETREIYLYGANKNKAPKSYYHLIKTSGSLAEYCAKFVKPGDNILCEGRIRHFPSAQDKTVWKSIVWADQVIMLCPLESLKDDLKEKFKSAIDKK